MFIDTHAHLASFPLKENIQEILNACKNANVEKIISIGCTLSEAKESLLLANTYREIFATAGLYPHDNEEEYHLNIKSRLKEIEALLKNKKVVAIGECGLDLKDPIFPEIKRDLKAQIELFDAQLTLSKQKKMPLIIHSREATQETLKIIENYKEVDKVWHCFTEDYESAKKALNYNTYISFTGIITYPKNTKLRESVKKIPLERIMIETDSPYLTPHLARKEGIKVNNPSYVRMIAQEISLIKNIKIDLVEEITSKNAIKFFRI